MNVSVVFTAIQFAVDAHGSQKRKDGKPYVGHPLRVMHRIMSFLQDGGRHLDLEGVRICEAAVLHDVLEDCDVTKDALEKRFGRTVAAYVTEVSDDRAQSKAQRKRAQVERAKTYSYGATLIKMADMLDNLSDRAEHPELFDERENAGYFLWKAAVFRAMPVVPGSLRAELMELFFNAAFKLTGPGVEKDALEKYYALCDRAEKKEEE